MINLKNISLRNIVTYDNADFDLSGNALSVIYGRNKDSGDQNSQSNGAGKSKLFTVLAETLTGSHPLIAGKQAVKDDFYRLNAEVSIEFDSYRLKKFKAGNTIKHSLAKRTKDGSWAELKSREPLDKLSEIFPISLDEFFSLYYIDSSRLSVLQRGTHVSRFKLLSDLFHLGDYDAILAELKEHSKELRAQTAKLSEVERQLAELPPVEADGLDEKIESLANRLTKLQGKRQEGSNLLALARTVSDHQEGIDRLKEEGWDGDYSSLKTFLKEVSSSIKVAEDKQREYARQQSQYEAYSKEFKRWKKAQEILSEHEITSASEVYSLRKGVRERNDLIKELKALQRTEEPSEPETDKPAKPSFHYEKLVPYYQSMVDSARESLDAASELRGGCKCPTCASDLSDSHVKKLVDTLTETINKHKKLIKQATADADSAKEWEQYDELFDSYKKAADRVKAVKSKIKELTDLDDETLDTIQAAMSIEKPKKVWKPVPIEVDVSELYEIRSLAKTILSFSDRLSEAEEQGANEYDADELAEDLAALDKKIRDVSDKLQRLNREYGAAQQTEERAAMLADRLSELEEATKDAGLLKILEAAYGPKGLKNVVISNLCAKVQANLNLYAPLLYSEKVTFALDVSETQLNILITRNFNGEQVTCDVRRLSGAESRQFNLLFPMAILPLVPEKRRLNVLVLDEPTANLDDSAVELFASAYLPKLKELVPHVIVLSPTLLPIDVDDSKSYCVTRENGVSTIAPL